MSTSPTLLTGRTMTYLREQGYIVDVAERHSPRLARKIFSEGRERMTFFLDRKIDLYGGIDLVAMRDDEGIIGVQVTSASNHAARRQKMLDSPELALWVRHAQLWVVSWRKVTDPPKSKRRVWKPRIEKLSAEDFAANLGHIWNQISKQTGAANV